jgi:hypothetical protein
MNLVTEITRKFLKIYDMTTFRAFESRGCCAVGNLSEPAGLSSSPLNVEK